MQRGRSIPGGLKSSEDLVSLKEIASYAKRGEKNTKTQGSDRGTGRAFPLKKLYSWSRGQSQERPGTGGLN